MTDLTKRLQACYEDPMWADHSEVPKVLLRSAADEIERLRAEYESACKLVADMHAAAVGYVGGPQVGAVEDVAALRTEIERLRARLSKAEHWTQHAMLMRSSQNRELLCILRGEAQREFLDGA